jgi:hypothetical protein
MASPKLIAYLEANAAKFISEMERSRKALSEVSDQAKNVNNSLTAIKWDAIASLATKGIDTIREGFETLEKATVKMQIEQTFYALANAAGMSGKSLLESMQQASQGTVSEMDLMKNAILGLKSHLDPEMFTKLTQAALEFSAVTGKTVTESLDTMFTVIQTGRMRQLAGMEENVRVINVQLENYALALGKNSVQELSAVQRATALYEILHQLAEGYKAANIQLSEQFLAIQKAKASWENFCDTMYKVALVAWTGITAAFWRGVAVIQNVMAALMDVVGGMFGLISQLPGLGFLKEYEDAAKKGSEAIYALAKKNNEYAASQEKAATSMFGKPIDIPGRGTPLPIQPGLPKSGVGVGQSQLQMERKIYEERMAILQKYAEQEKIITEASLSNLDVMRAQHLVSEGGYLDQKSAIEQQGTIRLKENLDEQIATTKESYDTMIADLKKTATKTADEKIKLNDQVLGLEAEKQKKIEELIKKGLDFEFQTLKENNQKIIAETQLTDKVLITSREGVLEQQKAQLDLETKIAQARAGVGEIRSGQAGMIELQNQLKSLDADRQHLEFLKDQATDEDTIEKLTNQINDNIAKRNELEQVGAITLKSETLPAYEGLAAGIQKYVTESGKLYTQLEGMTNSMARGMESAFSNFFVSIFDKTKSWKEKMAKLFQDLANSFIKALSDMAAKALVTNLLGGSTTGSTSLFGSLFKSIFGGGGSPTGSLVTGGGGINWNVASFQHGTEYVPQTGLAMLHQGETVIPAEQNKGEGGNTYITYIEATDVDSFAKRYGGVIESVYYKGKRFNRVSMR